MRARRGVAADSRSVAAFSPRPGGVVYCGESILIREFAHTVHEVGMKALDPGFEERLRALYEKARGAGLWENTYAATDFKEYWAEGVQSYFDANLRAQPANGIHNSVRTRAELEKYDPSLAKLIDQVFGGNPWRWVPVGAHARHWQEAPDSRE